MSDLELSDSKENLMPPAARRELNRVREMHQRSGSQPLRKTMLQERLEEQRFLILYEDGRPCEHRIMTLRELYNYAIKTITTRPSDGSPSDFEGSDKWKNVSKSAPDLGHTSFSSTASPTLGPRKPPPAVDSSSGKTSDDAPFPPIPPPIPLTESQENVAETGGTEGQQSSSASSSNVRRKGTSRQPKSSRKRFSVLPSVHEAGVSSPPPPPSSDFKRDQSGGVVDPQHTTYRQRLGGYLHPRDMRRLVTPFSSTNEPELIVRRHVMLLNFDKLRAVVLRDRMLVRVPDGADSMLMLLEKRVRGGIHAVEKEVFGEDEPYVSDVELMNASQHSLPSVKNWKQARHMRIGELDVVDDGDDKKQKTESDSDTKTADESRVDTSEEGSSNGSDTEPSPFFGEDDEWDDIKKMEWVELPFELQCVDAVLYTVLDLMSEDAFEVRRKAYIGMALLVGDTRSLSPGDHAQEKLRMLKDDVKEMEGRMRAFIRALNFVLDEDEDMTLMNLSRLITHPERFIQPVSREVLEEESDEPELILEAYMQQALSIVNGLEQVMGHISTTEELVDMKLDTVRNRLLYINTLVSVLSLCVATASLVGSIFGMNLINHLEEDEDAFRQIVIGTLVGTFSLLMFLLFIFNRAGKMPREKMFWYSEVA